MKTIIAVFIILTIQNYTSINPDPKISDNAKINNDERIQENSNDLIGTWEIRRYWADSGEKIKQITFSWPGKIFYNPYVGGKNIETFMGNYEATSDSIKIKFYKKFIFEFYKYKIVNDRLNLMKIETYAPDDYMLNNYPDVNIWKRVDN